MTNYLNEIICAIIIMKKFLMFAVIFISLFSASYGVSDLLPLQGKVYNSSGSPVNGEDLQVLIYDNLTAGNLVYNSSTDFDGKINNGEYDVLLGSGSVDLSLEYGRDNNGIWENGVLKE